jgi:hypothetical protein
VVYRSPLLSIELAQPRKVRLNHGRRDFVFRLRGMGVDATYLGSERTAGYV